MRSAIFAAIILVVLGSPALAQQSQPPCGPAAQLPSEFSTNVAPDSRCFELRMYTADTSRDGVGDYERTIDELHQRFREQEVAIFKKHGAEVAFRADREIPGVSIQAFIEAWTVPDRAHREEVWAAFRADPEWTALREKYPVGVSIQAFMMSASDYSALK